MVTTRQETLLRCLAVLAFTLLVTVAPALTRAEGTESAQTHLSEKSFLRTVDGKSGSDRLETSIATYSRPDGARVHLVAVVHIGDAGYYRKLNRIFEGYDALLYELVAEDDSIPLPDAESSNPLSLFQRSLTDVLDLQFQLDVIDYTRPNFIHADMNPEDFRRSQEERGEGFLTYFFRAYKTELERQAKGDFASTVSPVDAFRLLVADDKSIEMKRVLARQFADVDRVSETIDGEQGSAILTDRNKVAIEVLERVLSEGRRNVGIFYGAAHMPDMEERLTAGLGFKKESEAWLTAWKITPEKKGTSFFKRLFVPGASSEEPDSTNSNIKRRKRF